MYRDIFDLGGRILIGGVFAYSGFGKIMNFAGTQGFMESAGMPFTAFFLVCAIILELVGGLMLIAGFQTRWVALALAAFLVVATIIFHTDFSQQAQMLFFTKNLMIIGGTLSIAAQGSRRFAIDK